MSEIFESGDVESRILVLAPMGRDAPLIVGTLEKAGLLAIACDTGDTMLTMLRRGAAAAIIAQEALSPAALNRLTVWLQAQPPWSDLPIVVLTSSGRPDLSNYEKAQELERLGNVTFLERPLRPETLRTSMRAAVRARLRQYEMGRRQQTLTRVNADLEQFAHSASHDLQEPLRNVAIYSEILARRYGDVLDAQGQEFLKYLRAGAVQMQNLVRDLLSYTQAASITDEAPEPSDVTKTLEAVLASLQQSIGESGAKITYGVLPPVRIREVHLKQLFQNLIGNAIKYRCPDPPAISITAARNDGSWVFAVKDNGIGIPAEFKERIFGIFKRLHTNEKYAGTGIGLAICKRIVERYRGRIWVESQPGHGATFFFSVPV